MALVPGSRLGRYEIVRQLGAGAMGEVYLAEDPHIERLLAIKTLKLDELEQGDDPKHSHLRMRIEREAKAAGRLVHPHIVTLFDAGEAEGVFYLAFEFVEGCDLSARIRADPPLTVLDIVRIGREVSSALDAAHRVGIVHRDIKPSNLLVTVSGTVKVADFGIATLVGQTTQLTRTGGFVGTAFYVSPEQAQSEKSVDGRSDLFSLGVVLYELLSGRRPFVGETLPAILIAIIMKDPVSLAQLRPDLSPRLCEAVMRLLAKEPDQRFSTAAALGEELGAIEREMLPSAPAVIAAPATVATAPSTAVAAAPTVADAVMATPRRGGLFLGVVLILIALASATALIARYIGTPSPEQRDAASAVTNTGGGTLAPVQTPSQRPLENATTPQIGGAHPTRRAVGGVVTFRIHPPEAGERAVARIDGLVRGLASGSMMTLRPGAHEIEIVAEGFETARMLVESRADVSEAVEIEMTLKKR